MNFLDLITGNDMTREHKALELRAKELPADHRSAWEEVKENIWQYSDLTGRNLIPILDGVLSLLEESAVDGQSARETLGDDIKGFCSALAGEEGAQTYRDKWREQLNKTVAEKLNKLGG